MPFVPFYPTMVAVSTITVAGESYLIRNHQWTVDDLVTDANNKVARLTEVSEERSLIEVAGKHYAPQPDTPLRVLRFQLEHNLKMDPDTAFVLRKYIEEELSKRVDSEENIKKGNDEINKTLYDEIN